MEEEISHMLVPLWLVFICGGISSFVVLDGVWKWWKKLRDEVAEGRRKSEESARYRESSKGDPRLEWVMRECDRKEKVQEEIDLLLKKVEWLRRVKEGK